MAAANPRFADLYFGKSDSWNELSGGRDDFYAHELTEVDRATRRDLGETIVRIDQVSARFVNDPNSDRFSVPETNGGQQHSVSSLSDRRPQHGNIIGWIVRVQS